MSEFVQVSIDDLIKEENIETFQKFHPFITKAKRFSDAEIEMIDEGILENGKIEDSVRRKNKHYVRDTWKNGRFRVRRGPTDCVTFFYLSDCFEVGVEFAFNVWIIHPKENEFGWLESGRWYNTNEYA